MLNEIKAYHPDVNVYMNTLVDEAIRYYYPFGFKKEKNNICFKVRADTANRRLSSNLLIAVSRVTLLYSRLV
jgi:hypothetical protein